MASPLLDGACSGPVLNTFSGGGRCEQQICVLHGGGASASNLLADVPCAVLDLQAAWCQAARSEALASNDTFVSLHAKGRGSWCGPAAQRFGALRNGAVRMVRAKAVLATAPVLSQNTERLQSR